MTLLARLQAATGPDRELDARIWAETNDMDVVESKMLGRVMLSGRPRRPLLGDCIIYSHGDAVSHIPRFSASVDAALSWMPEGAYLLYVRYDENPRMDGRQWNAVVVFSGQHRGEGRTMQGAINVAIAKARGIE